MQKHVNLVDLVKSFPTIIVLQNLASIQKRTNPIKFAHLAEKSENGSISNLSAKVLHAYEAIRSCIRMPHPRGSTLRREWVCRAYVLVLLLRQRGVAPAIEG